jgi:hypothetical protein
MIFTRRKVDERPFYLISSAGVPNYGDELITRAWLDWLHENHPGVPVWLDCIEPGRAFHLFRSAHPLLHTTNTLWHLVLSGAGMALDEGTAHVSRIIRELGSPRFDAGLRDLREVRSLHLLGGGYLNSVWPHQLLLLPALVALRGATGIPLFATGQGVEPLDSHARDRAAEWSRAFDVFETRDARGAALIGAVEGIDDAFLSFTNSRSLYSAGGSPDLMLLLQGDFGGADNATALVDGVCAYIERHDAQASVGVVESLPPDDSWILPRLTERGIIPVHYPFLRIWDEGLPARSGQAWLSTRFHFHLMAAAAGAEGVVLNLNDAYYGAKHRALLDLGTGWTEVGAIDQIADAAPGNPGVFGTVEHRTRLGELKDGVARRIYAR